MRTLYCRLIFVFIVPILITFLAGCAMDVPQEDEVYYGGSVYDPYYDAGSPMRAYDYDPSYDPWTVSTYYQYYIDVSGADASPGSSNTGGTRSEGRRSFATGGDFTSVHQSRAPSDERASLRRSAIRERRGAASESSSSSITRQKVRRDVRRGTTQTSQKGEEQAQKVRRKEVRSSKAGKEDEEKSKKAPQN